MKTLEIFEITFFATMLLCTSCDLIAERIGFKANKEKEKSEAIETQIPYDYSISKSQKTVVKTFDVRAEIYKVIQKYEFTSLAVQPGDIHRNNLI